MTDSDNLIDFNIDPQLCEPSGHNSIISFADPLRQMFHDYKVYKYYPVERYLSTLENNISYLNSIIRRFDLTKIARPDREIWFKTTMPMYSSEVTEHNIWSVVDYRAGFQAELDVLIQFKIEK